MPAARKLLLELLLVLVVATLRLPVPLFAVLLLLGTA
jgi:hypothetical protein